MGFQGGGVGDCGEDCVDADWVCVDGEEEGEGDCEDGGGDVHCWMGLVVGW